MTWLNCLHLILFAHLMCVRKHRGHCGFSQSDTSSLVLFFLAYRSLPPDVHELTFMIEPVLMESLQSHKLRILAASLAEISFVVLCNNIPHFRRSTSPSTLSNLLKAILQGYRRKNYHVNTAMIDRYLLLVCVFALEEVGTLPRSID